MPREWGRLSLKYNSQVILRAQNLMAIRKKELLLSYWLLIPLVLNTTCYRAKTIFLS